MARLDGIGADDHACAGDSRTLNTELADSTQANHQRDRSHRWARGEQHCSDACQRCTSEQRGLLGQDPSTYW